MTVLELSGISKAYGGLRPLRLEGLKINAAESVAMLGFDRPAAEVFVNLVTGASLPDKGQVTVFGRPTSSIADSAEWLQLVDRFGIVSDRVVLLEGMTSLQNLALPFTLDFEPLADDTRERALLLATEVGLSDEDCLRRIADLDAAARGRVRLARAIALDPAILLLEHSSATMDPESSAAFGERVQTVAARRGAAIVALTADGAFAEAVAERVVRLDPATGRLSGRGRWLARFRRRIERA